MRPPACNGVSVVDMSMGPHGYTAIPLLTHNGLVFEYVDQGAHYYRHFFNGMGQYTYHVFISQTSNTIRYQIIDPLKNQISDIRPPKFFF